MVSSLGREQPASSELVLILEIIAGAPLEYYTYTRGLWPVRSPC